MMTSAILPLLSDGASVGYQLSSPPSETELVSTVSTHKPTNLLLQIKNAIDHIVTHLRILEEEAKEDAYTKEKNAQHKADAFLTAKRKHRAIQTILEEVILIQNYTQIYSSDLFYGVIGALPSEPDGTREVFLNIPATVTNNVKGLGTSIIRPAIPYQTNPNYSLTVLSVAPAMPDSNEVHHLAHRAAIALHSLYNTVQQWLFGIKELQLKEHNKDPSQYRLDTYAYDFRGEKLPELKSARSTSETYKAVERVATQLIAPCEAEIAKVEQETAKKYPSAIYLESPAIKTRIELAKEEVYAAIKKIVDKNSHATRGIANFNKIIYGENPLGEYSEEKLTALLDEASQSDQRRVCCFFTPGRSMQTKILYAQLKNFNENYASWSQQTVTKIKADLADYYQKGDQKQPGCLTALFGC